MPIAGDAYATGGDVTEYEQREDDSHPGSPAWEIPEQFAVHPEAVSRRDHPARGRHDADDAERKTRQRYFLAQGIDVRKELFHKIPADYADPRIVLEVGIIDVPPALYFFAADIDEALLGGRARRFAVQLAGTGVFGSGKLRTLWVGAERHPELVVLRDKIERALIRIGLAPEPRKFAPHVTLARLRDPALGQLGEFLCATAQFRAAPLPVEHFSLIASFPTKAGSIYEDQADYPLSG